MNSSKKISTRLLTIIDALPLQPNMRILEIGCGTGVAAREIASRIGMGHIHAIDRSEKAIQQAIKLSQDEIKSGRIFYQCIAIEDFELPKGNPLFDLAFAIRVGALDGRHPEIEKMALEKIAKVLKKKGRLFIDNTEVNK